VHAPRPGSSPEPAESRDNAAELLDDLIIALTNLPDDVFLELGRNLPRSLLSRAREWIANQARNLTGRRCTGEVPAVLQPTPPISRWSRPHKTSTAAGPLAFPKQKRRQSPILR